MAEPLRVATFHTELSRDGPGLLVQALRSGKDAQTLAVLDAILDVNADLISLQGMDWDHGGMAVKALQNQLQKRGLTYSYAFTARPNAGVPTGLDVDGDGRLGGPGDNQGWGWFSGQGGLAVLSKHPILRDEVVDYTALRWADLPDRELPFAEDGAPFFDSEVLKVLRLSSTNHWVVPIQLPNGAVLRMVTFHATPPVFDGVEDRNGLRNRDELRLASMILDGLTTDGEAGRPIPRPFVLAAAANLDPLRGEGRKAEIRALLARPALQDLRPRDAQGEEHTVEWQGVGKMRVDYVLPSADLNVKGAGIRRSEGSRHGLVWVDVLQSDLP